MCFRVLDRHGHYGSVTTLSTYGAHLIHVALGSGSLSYGLSPLLSFLFFFNVSFGLFVELDYEPLYIGHALVFQHNPIQQRHLLSIISFESLAFPSAQYGP